ncbi:uncharacterized protein [Rutidosis leptorrhynchoides]|uniref:uncharacterized protein n=1 Tax=Rutidosis leptorrhynchoides TaxID=125765 RepID=UPI003A99E951
MKYPYSNNIIIPQDNYHTQSFSSSSFSLPSPINFPIEDEAVFCDFFNQHQFFSNDHNHHNSNMLAHDMTNNMEESTVVECSNNNNIGNVAMNNDADYDQWDINVNNNNPMEPERKKHSKRDRHSKINTARGLRDRRMRLSLDVAKKLFGLQDLLGFDKASKTVDWLIQKSKASILELLPDPSCSFMGVSNSASSTSECEVLSGTVDQSMLIKSTGYDHDDQVAKSSSESSKKQKEKSSSKLVRRCADFHHPLAKATRDRARERARERTISKRNSKHGGGGDHDQVSKFRPFLNQDVNQLGFCSPSERLIGNDQLDRMSSNLQTNSGFVGDNSSLLMTGNWSPDYLFNYQHSFGQNEHQLNEYQLNGKVWEGNYN